MRISDWSSDVCSSDLGQPALVAPVVIPFAAIILVAVQHPEAAIDMDAFEVIVDEVVAPAVELETGGWWAIEGKKAAVDRVPFRQFLQGIDRKRGVEGQSMSVRVDLGGRRIIKK